MRSQRLLDKVERVCLDDSLVHGTNANTEYAVAGAKTGTEPCLPRPATFHLAFHW